MRTQKTVLGYNAQQILSRTREGVTINSGFKKFVTLSRGTRVWHFGVTDQPTGVLLDTLGIPMILVLKGTK